MESGIFVGFRMKFSEYILIANVEAINLLGQSAGNLCQKGGPTLRRSSTYRSGHGTDLGTWQEAAVRPIGESGVNATPNLD